MAKRSYDQFCPIARALDFVGERWTLLVVRELLFGPKRYTDLLAGLPGINANVLSTRLKDLQAADLIERTTMPPPAASTVYQLTELGRGLEPAIAGLAQWGLNFLDVESEQEELRLGWYRAGLQTSFRREAAVGVDDTYELRIGDDVLHVHVVDGTVEVRNGPASAPDLTFTTDYVTYAQIGRGDISGGKALATGKATVEGDPAAGARMQTIFSRRALFPEARAA
jgi:DNA-binding HxlR family transcriptional regulator/putative sterol carrier protein